MTKSTFKITHKIIGAFCFCVLSVLAFAVLSLQVHREIGRKLQLVEIVDDLVNNILETRRLERNFFLYHAPSSLSEALLFVDRVEQLHAIHKKEISGAGLSQDRDLFLEKLTPYRGFLTKIQGLLAQGTIEANTVAISASELSLRNLGHEILDIAVRWRNEERVAIEQLYRKALYLFVISMGVFLILGILVAFYISRLLMYPLLQMQEAMSKIARGDFTPISESERRSEEFRPLFSAFNRMIGELEERQEQLIQSRKIAAIGTLTSGVAHELNNPINNIVLTAESLMEDFHQLEPVDALEMLQDILVQSEKAAEIVKHLLDFSRSQQPKFESLSIALVIQDALKLVKNQMALSRIHCETELPMELPDVFGDAKSLQQVFVNLFINAIQAMPDGGILKIHAALSEDGRGLEIAISDTGVGIDPHALPHIFDPFFTTKEVGKGTGLGLSVSYGIVQKHGGRVTARSQKGRGTTFTVTLPVQEQDDVSEGVGGVHADRRGG